MSDWRDYLTADERARMDAIPEYRRKLTAEYRAIFERCRQRAKRAALRHKEGKP